MNMVECPYKGLMPYDEKDQKYFFGRERETQIIISNMYAASLTTLYGTSGVGKSSVLRAGVVSKLRAQAAESLDQGQIPDVCVVYFNTWQKQVPEEEGGQDPEGEKALNRLKATIKDSLSLTLRENVPQCFSKEGTLREVLRSATKSLGGDVMVILDQFEEYFLYYPQSFAPHSFATEFIDVVNDYQLPVSFLLSIRGDSLSTLDRFKRKNS